MAHRWRLLALMLSDCPMFILADVKEIPIFILLTSYVLLCWGIRIGCDAIVHSLVPRPVRVFIACLKSVCYGAELEGMSEAVGGS